MANSTQSVVSDGTLALLDLSINYLDRSEISVYFDAVLTTDWAWVGTTAKQITFSPVVPVGTNVLVKRTTNISKLRHEFSKGAAFSPGVLDEDLTQVLHIAQEASEANLSSIRIIDAIKDSHRTLDSYADEILKRGYRLGRVFLPHDGFHKDYKTGKSAEEILKRYKFKVKPVPNVSIEAGIKAARATLPQTVFEKSKAAAIVDAMKRYKRSINSSTDEPGAPLHDDASHGADNFRYIALCAEQMTNEDEGDTPIKVEDFGVLDAELGI